MVVRDEGKSGGGAGTCIGKEKDRETVREKHKQTKWDGVAINGSLSLTVSHRLNAIEPEQEGTFSSVLSPK